MTGRLIRQFIGWFITDVTGHRLWFAATRKIRLCETLKPRLCWWSSCSTLGWFQTDIYQWRLLKAIPHITPFGPLCCRQDFRTCPYQVSCRVASLYQLGSHTSSSLSFWFHNDLADHCLSCAKVNGFLCLYFQFVCVVHWPATPPSSQPASLRNMSRQLCPRWHLDMLIIERKQTEILIQAARGDSL